MSDSSARPTFSSAFAAVCATSAVAIGLVNICRFPYMMGKCGGAAFLLIYLLFVVALLSLAAAYEVIVAALGGGLGWSRTHALSAVLISQIVLAWPALIFDRYIELSDLIWGTTMQPVGAVIAGFGYHDLSQTHPDFHRSPFNQRTRLEAIGGSGECQDRFGPRGNPGRA